MQSINFKNIFVDTLPGDPQEANYPRQVHQGFYSKVHPKKVASPFMIIYSDDVATSLGLSKEFTQSDDFLSILSGNMTVANSIPYAMCYGGHQFGHWAGQLGDGRAINLGEIITKSGIQTIQLKGAGPTPYSRTADGFAVLRSSIREYLCSEAMYHLGVPTTRALSLALTGENVMRDILYDGHPAYEKGAVLSRVSPSFIRFGSFEIWAARRDEDKIKLLADYTIDHHYPHLKGKENKYLLFFEEVVHKTCDLIIEWQRVGFVHGVMNTDNMSVIGLTIDYGPYGWIDNYDPNWTPNTTDMPGRRYRFGNQPVVAQWNLLQLANALYPLINDEDGLRRVIDEYGLRFKTKYQQMMLSKLGIFTYQDTDETLVKQTEKVFQLCNIDYTIGFRSLAAITIDMSLPEMIAILNPALYDEDLDPDKEDMLEAWLTSYQERLRLENMPHGERVNRMNQVNPKYVLRNYMAQMAIEAADNGDYSLIYEFYHLLKQPYAEQPEYQHWYAKRPEWALEKVGCSMLSCSS